MSVVLAYVKDDVIYFGCDNRINIGTEYESIPFSKGFKLQKYKDYVLGFVGKPPLDIKALGLIKKFNVNELTKEYLVKNFFKELISIAKGYSHIDESSNGNVSFNSSLFVAKGNRLFLINSNGVTRIKTYSAIGSGTRFVLPYLYNMDENNIKQTMLDAMKYCTSKHGKVGGPYHFINTKDLVLETEE